MSADLLRRAAAKMRENAEAATPGPWRDCPMGSEGSIVLAGGNTITTARRPARCREFADATHIASWHPAVAVAVADWLEDIYPLLPCDNCTSSEARCRMARTNGAIACCPECAHAAKALKVARAYLGEDA